MWWSLQMIAQSLVAGTLSYRTRGAEHVPRDSGALLLINHRSGLDPILAGLPLDRPVSFVARHNLFEIPGLGWLLRKNYTIPLNRDAPGTSSLREIVRRLEHGFLVGLFPEGTRQTGPQPLGPLKPGFLSILRRTDVPVIPVGIAGASAVMPRGAVFPRPRPVRVVFGEPIPEAAITPHTARGHERELLALVALRMTTCVTAAQTWLAYSESTPHNF
jgi:1-acyl-sn-glycerol-3-phosphate acyltransferase